MESSLRLGERRSGVGIPGVESIPHPIIEKVTKLLTFSEPRLLEVAEILEEICGVNNGIGGEVGATVRPREP